MSGPPVEKLPQVGKEVQVLDGTYTIVNLASGTALKIKGTQYVVGDARLLSLSEQPKEQWTIAYDWTNKGYTLKNVSSGTYLTSDQLYTPLVQGQTEVFQGTSSSLFTLHSSTVTGAYSLVPNDYSSNVVELFSGSPAPDTAVQIVDSDGSDKQLWTFAASTI
ncbi:hypothetical protein CALCODRAFT_515592 [Calocera cornea HHB12733]|uniref:Ricin B lectin domain-containing protein n=1 Tax=Calocera cornea HHB12733 TaxID=1353952 RepID=A0A165I7P5_9BASI|nr:hypothetical protein CALCODRAFT_515592 [Calocera cornea HHB12733]